MSEPAAFLSRNVCVPEDRANRLRHNRESRQHRVVGGDAKTRRSRFTDAKGSSGSSWETPRLSQQVFQARFHNNSDILREVTVEVTRDKERFAAGID